LKISICCLAIRVSLAIVSLVLIASCASRQEPPPVPAPVVAPAPPPPQARKSAPKQVRASYMGTEQEGRRTASGEIYDPNELTAASKTLPLGSTVEVTNPSTGRSVRVRINDRGPYVRGRSIDLSKRAAEEIGLTEKGVGRVKIKRVDSKSKPTTTHTVDASTDSKSASAPTPTLNASSDR
jgi:rare lipoprotein A (peptidoglycan hydrolase)